HPAFGGAEESVSLWIFEPFDGAFQTFHVRPPSFFADFPLKRRDSRGPQKMCRHCAAARGDCQDRAIRSRITLLPVETRLAPSPPGGAKIPSDPSALGAAS